MTTSVPEAMPALLRAQRLGAKAARAQLDGEGCDLHESLGELETAPDQEQALGDVLFELCQRARRMGVNAEDSLRAANRRFVERCRRHEQEQR